jgi:hypothetical protein
MKVHRTLFRNKLTATPSSQPKATGPGFGQ